MTADLALVRDADVFLVFIESYGAIAYERPDMAPRLAAGARRSRRRHSRHRPRRRLGVRRVADLRRIVVARAPQPDVRRRGPRSRDQRAADDRAARDDRDHLQARGPPHGRADAGPAAGVARGRLLRLRRHLRRDAARLPRAGVRLVRDPRSVLAGEVRRARGRRSRRARRCSSSSPPSARTSRSSRRRRISRTGAGCFDRAPVRRPVDRPRVRAAARLDALRAGLRAGDRVRLRDARRLPAAARRSRFRDDSARRPRAGGGGQRRGRVRGTCRST